MTRAAHGQSVWGRVLLEAKTEPAVVLSEPFVVTDRVGRATAEAVVSNPTHLPETYAVDVLGQAAAFARVDPARLTLVESEPRKVTIHFELDPALVPVDELPFAVRVKSVDHIARVGIAEGDVAIDQRGRRRSPSRPRAWRLLAVALACMGAAGLLWWNGRGSTTLPEAQTAVAPSPAVSVTAGSGSITHDLSPNERGQFMLSWSVPPVEPPPNDRTGFLVSATQPKTRRVLGTVAIDWPTITDLAPQEVRDLLAPLLATEDELEVCFVVQTYVHRRGIERRSVGRGGEGQACALAAA